MGSWYETCQVSHLPIQDDDEIVVIPLLKRRYSHEPGFYVDDIYVPFTSPIYGKYTSDCGMGYEWKATKETEEFVKSLTYQQDEKEIKVTNISQFLNLLEQRYVKVDDGAFGFAELNYFMCHRQIFDTIVNEVYNRKNYKGEVYGELVTNHYKNYFKNKYEEFTKIGEDEKKRLAYGFELSEMLVDLHFFPSNAKHLILMKFAKKLLFDNANDEEIEEFIKLKIFSDGLDLARMGYLNVTGKGSQGCEFYIHKLISQFVIKKSHEEYRKFKKESCEKIDEDEFLRDSVGYSF